MEGWGEGKWGGVGGKTEVHFHNTTRDLHFRQVFFIFFHRRVNHKFFVWGGVRGVGGCSPPLHNDKTPSWIDISPHLPQIGVSE